MGGITFPNLSWFKLQAFSLLAPAWDKYQFSLFFVSDSLQSDLSDMPDMKRHTMSVPTRSQVNWAKTTAMRIMEDIKQAVTGPDVSNAKRWDPGEECSEERYKVKIGNPDALCNTLVCTSSDFVHIRFTHLS